MYLDANNSYGWAMFQKLPVNGFKWKTNVSIFDEDFIPTRKNKNLKNAISLCAICLIKKKMLFK